MTPEFKKAVEDKKLAMVRMMLSNELLSDPTGQSFGEMLAYAKDRLPDLFEAEKPSKFSIPADKAEWNDEVLSQMKRDLNMNFSVEKLTLFVEMAKFLGKKTPEVKPGHRTSRETAGTDREDIDVTVETDDIDDTDNRNRRRSTTRRRMDPVKATGTVVTGGGVAIAITSLALKSSVLAIIGGAVIIGGVALLCMPRKN